MKKKIIYDIMDENNGIVESKEVLKSGVSNKYLQRMKDTGDIERIAPGLYMNSDLFSDDFYIMQYRVSKGIFSHETALFLHDLSDRVPLTLTMTIPSGYNSRLLKDKERYNFFYIKKELLDLGKITVNSPYGNKIFVYDKERTICDCLKKRKKLDYDLVLSAIKQYAKEERDLQKLFDYAKLLGTTEIVRQYFEVLL